jgi:glycosyltransferase involved in cell wall biosynthesis
MSTEVLFLVNGDERSPMGYRARAFAERLPDRWRSRILYRSQGRFLSIGVFLRAIAASQPSIVYVLDMAVCGVIAGAAARFLRRTVLVIDTGDAISALAQSIGRGPIGVLLTRVLEAFAFRVADQIVVRGTFHRQWLADRHIDAEVIPDGVDLQLFRPIEDDSIRALRRELDVEKVLAVGLVGSSVWCEKLQMAYGWELVEALALLKDRPVRGVIIGDGTGIPHLRARCRELDVQDRVTFLGRIPFEMLPSHLNAFDVCLSTQSNDLAGQVRTTGKLPLYLACGRYVLASKVGEAALVLPPDMLIDYEGTKDGTYPAKLAQRLSDMLTRSEDSPDTVSVARERFDYDRLTARLTGMFDTLVARSDEAVALSGSSSR